MFVWETQKHELNSSFEKQSVVSAALIFRLCLPHGANLYNFFF